MMPAALSIVAMLYLVGDVDNNLNRADAVLHRANPENLDLLVLPELAFSGYNFCSLQHIAPFLEPTTAGITTLWARTTALKYNCTVTAGYPEIVDLAPKWQAILDPKYYNSAVVVDADGETVLNYRKSFLYRTDETWALEGRGFFSGPIAGLGHVAMGICMDLNPYKFEAPWSAWEFSNHILRVKPNLVIMPMAWLTLESYSTYSQAPREPDMDTLSYWLARLEPLIRAEEPGEIIVVFANRCGTEDEATYAGTSAVLGINAGEVKVYGVLGRGEKELLVVDTDDYPQAKLVSQRTAPFAKAMKKEATELPVEKGEDYKHAYNEDFDEVWEEYDYASPISPSDGRRPQAFFGSDFNPDSLLRSTIGLVETPINGPIFHRYWPPKFNNDADGDTEKYGLMETPISGPRFRRRPPPKSNSQSTYVYQDTDDSSEKYGLMEATISDQRSQEPEETNIHDYHNANEITTKYDRVETPISGPIFWRRMPPEEITMKMGDWNQFGNRNSHSNLMIGTSNDNTKVSRALDTIAEEPEPAHTPVIRSHMSTAASLGHDNPQAEVQLKTQGSCGLLISETGHSFQNERQIEHAKDPNVGHTRTKSKDEVHNASAGPPLTFARDVLTHSAPMIQPRFDSSFTRNPLGPRSLHISTRPLSTVW